MSNFFCHKNKTFVLNYSLMFYLYFLNKLFFLKDLYLKEVLFTKSTRYKEISIK